MERSPDLSGGISPPDAEFLASHVSFSARLRRLPWWLFALFLISILVGVLIFTDAEYSEAFNFIKVGLQLTILTSLGAYAVALIFGLLAGLGRISSNVIVNNIATFYVEIIRGIPMLVLIFYIALVGVPTAVGGINGLGDLMLGIRTVTADSIDLNSSPAWSPDGEQIAFISQKQEDKQTDLLLVAASGGSEFIPLTSDAAVERFPVWSPDSSRLAFMSTSDENSDIALIGADGTDSTPLAATEADELFPAWSPDGSQIAYLVENEEGAFSLALTNVATGEATALTLNIPVFARPADDNPHVVWSPDGQWLAFMGMSGDDNVDIYAARPDGSEMVRLTDSPGEDLFPVWSPDGSQLAFTSRRGGDYLNLYLMSISAGPIEGGGTLAQVTELDTNVQDVRWSPDGESFTFTGREAGNLDVYTIGVDGTGLRRLMYTNGEDKSPVWSPTGNQIAYTSVRSSNPTIYAVRTGFKPLGFVGRILTSFDNQSIPLNFRAIVALAVTYGAFLAEIFRAGIQSIGRGQMEAARSLGMSYAQAMRYVILPQAIRNMLPALGNDFVSMLKDSSLVSVLAVRDITQLARLHAGSSFRFREAYTTLAVLYLSMTVILSLLVAQLERRLRSDER